MKDLQDSFGRRFSYLRLSITDACNFSCAYCLPHGFKKQGVREPLCVEEIFNLVSAMAEMGTWKVRLTGGEPTLRRDFIEIIRMIATVPQIRKIALSTNGYRLKHIAEDLKKAGVSALNVSIDSLNPQTFQEITGHDKLSEILQGIDRAIQLSFDSVKVNAVLLKNWNDQDLLSFVHWVQDKPISIRFIELMPTGQNQGFFSQRHTQSTEIQKRLLGWGWRPLQRKEGDGPALEFGHPQFMGRVGIIAPYSKDFCTSCNRLRVTSYGELRLCLFGDGNHSIRHLLSHSSQKEELKNEIQSLLKKKEISHFLPEGKFGNNETFSHMGG